MTHFTVLTLNAWGAPYARQRHQRYKALAGALKQKQPDVVLLQEVFMTAERKRLIADLRDTYPHHYYFPSAQVGSGLLTLSKFPIVDAYFHRFRMGGKIERLEQGDFYAGKGIGMTRLQTPSGIVDVYNAHAHAQYEHYDDNEYAVYTQTNLFEAARLVNSLSKDNPVILCGDLNTRPGQTGYSLIRQVAALTDAYMLLHDERPITFSPANPYVQSPPQCLDYILIRSGSSKLIVEECELALTERIQVDGATAYADHYAVEAKMCLDDTQGEAPVYNSAAAIECLNDLDERIAATFNEVARDKNHHNEHAFIGVAAAFDTLAFGGLLTRIFGKWGHSLRLFALVGSLVYAAYHSGSSFLSLNAREQTLLALQQEVRLERQKHE